MVTDLLVALPILGINFQNLKNGPYYTMHIDVKTDYYFGF